MWFSLKSKIKNSQKVFLDEKNQGYFKSTLEAMSLIEQRYKKKKPKSPETLFIKKNLEYMEPRLLRIIGKKSKKFNKEEK